jgi:hypothetical protein
MPSSKGRLTLPENPHLEQLRAQAKERLEVIRADAPDAQLSDAQLAVARDYGFPSWRALKAEVDRRSDTVNGLVGYYAEPSSSNTLWSVTAKGQRLFVETSSRGAPIEIIPQPDGAFTIPGLTRRYQFERDSAGRARAFIVQAEAGSAVRAARISAEKAAQMRAKRDLAGKAEWRARTAIEVSADILERYVGYYADTFGAVMEFVRDERKLLMQTATQTRVPLDAESEVDFFVPNARLEFHFRVQGDVATSAVFRRLGTEAVLSRISPEAAAGRRSIISLRAAEQAQPRQLAAPVPHEILAHYEGRYRIENGLEMIIEANDGRLFVQLVVPVGKPPRYEIFPESVTKFFWTAMAAQISFFADTEAKVSYGVWHQGGHLLPMGRIDEARREAAPAA